MEPLFFGIITKPWQVYVTALVVASGSGLGLWIAVVRANRAEERRAQKALWEHEAQETRQAQAH